MSIDTSTQPLLIPPLVDGDRLTRDEFERRYHNMPDLKKAELIEGVVYMGSPVSYRSHGVPHLEIAGLMFVYRAHTPGIGACDNGTVRLDWNNEPQPDVTAFIEPEYGGRVIVSEDDYLEGSPEVAVEVSFSSERIDSTVKFQAYLRNGIQEYALWRVEKEKIDWFARRGDQYVPLPADAEGVVKSEVFPGLRIDVHALIEGDTRKGLAVLNRGLASPEHAAFVERLQRAKASRSEGSPRS